MAKVRYEARAFQNGKMVRKEVFKRQNRALAFVRTQIDKLRTVRLRKRVLKGQFTIVSNKKWGVADHDAWEAGPKPLKTVFIHTSVTKQLEPGARASAEMEQMRSVDAIAHGRGFNGISYSVGVFPSGRAYEGRGFGKIEAATEGHNTTSDSICTIGNTDAFAPTKAQIEGIVATIKWGQRFGYLARSGLDVRAHNEVAAKACPGALFPPSLIQQIQKRVN